MRTMFLAGRETEGGGKRCVWERGGEGPGGGRACLCGEVGALGHLSLDELQQHVALALRGLYEGERERERERAKRERERE